MPARPPTPAPVPACVPDPAAQAGPRRRAFLGQAGGLSGALGLSGVATVTGLGGLLAGCGGSSSDDRETALRDLDAKIEDAMARYQIPGVALGLWLDGHSTLKGYGVSHVDQPTPVDADTLFRIGSNSKVLCGTTAATLIDRGELDLDQPVERYVRDFVPPPGGEGVTVRQLLNHTCGWLGYDYHDTGPGDDALAQYARDIRRLPQLTPPGRTFSYSNSGLGVAGRVIETITGTTYEDAVQRLLLDPLGMASTGYDVDAYIGRTIAAPHAVDDDGAPIVVPELWALPRSMNPFGGAIASVRDVLAFARFHLGDGKARGRRVMREGTLLSMRRDPGAGGTLLVELDGAGISWMVRPTAEGPKVVHHGGDVPGYHSGLMLVPDRDFAITVLTNSENGPKLIEALFFDDWALDRFVGLHNLPATPRTLDAAALAAYEGAYLAQQIPFDGSVVDLPLRITAQDGGLVAALGPRGAQTRQTLRFYRNDYVLVTPLEGPPNYVRASFVRGGDGTVAWFRLGGRLFRRQG